MKAATRFVLEQLSQQRFIAALTVTVLATGVAYFGGYWVASGLSLPIGESSIFWTTLPWLLSLRVAADFLGGLSSQRWRYIGLWDTVDVAVAVFSSSIVFGLLARSPLYPPVPWSVVLVETFVSANLLILARIGFRVVFEFSKKPPSQAERQRTNTLIVGAGEAGNLISHEASRYPEYGYDIVGFVDDDEAKIGSKIRGVSVMGSTEEIPLLVREQDIDRVLVAVPSAGPELLQRINALCQDLEVDLEILAVQNNQDDSQVGLQSIRDVEIRDLIARSPVSLDMSPVAEALKNRTVLITGAAGSIGSELSRQVINHASPARLVLLDQAESDLYMLERELKASTANGPELATVICDILNEGRLEKIFDDHPPDFILHAAAYKHVPLLEANPAEALENNVFGTLQLARAAGQHEVGSFVLISTDKAVEPSNVMGVTKRVAELVVLACRETFPDTSYRAVRFGNVIGSQGSVLPIFKRQLEAGEPLTVTHPKVSRFFMTAREAAQLVLQAAVLDAVDGRIGMLDMGEPVRIVDLARNLIRLSSHDSSPDERIEFTGLRPGEKLTESLVASRETVEATEVPKVYAISDPSLDIGPEFLREIIDLSNRGAEKHRDIAWLRNQFRELYRQ